MSDKAKKIVLNIMFPVIVAAAVLLNWAVAAAAIGASLILPTPAAAVREFFAYFADADFWRAVGNTMWRSLYSFLISFVLAFVFAVLAERFSVAKKLINPFVSFIRSVPTMSVILILIICLDSARAPAVVAIIVIFPTLYSSFSAAIGEVDSKLVEMSKVYKVGAKDRLLQLYIPNMAAGLFEGAASGFSLNIKLVIAAEALAATARSIGNMMNFSKALLETEKLFALTIAAVILSVACEWLIRLIGRAVIRWK